MWQGHQAPQQAAYGWQPQPPRKSRAGLVVGIVVAVLLLVGGAVTAGVLLVTRDDAGALAVGDLEEGMCLSSSDLAGGNSEVDDMTETDCDAEHDAEVFALLEAGEDESFEDAGTRCAQELEVDYSELSDKGVEVRPLAESSELEVGDPVACFLRNKNGDPLTEELV